MAEPWLEKFARVVEASRRLLMHERLMHGAWGKTMKTYLRLTQPPRMWRPETSDLYRRLGSVTHTHHALRALRTYHELLGIPFPVAEAMSVANYMATWQVGTGDVPSPVTNLAEGMPNADPLAPDWPANREFWASMLRHTGTALTSMTSLIKLLDIEPARFYAREEHDHREMWQMIAEKWTAEADMVAKCQGSLRKMAELATKSLARNARAMEDRILLDDGTWPKVVYSPAYVVAGVHEGNTMFGHHLDPRDQEDLRKFEDFLLNYLANLALGKHETYLCQSQHPESCYYYTLVILDHYLSVIHERSGNVAEQASLARQILGIAEHLLLQLATILKRNGGLPMGLSTGGTKLSVDVGTTARFALVSEKLRLCFEGKGGALPEELSRAAKQALYTAIDMVDSGSGSSDLMTHSFEALVRAVECVGPDARREIASHILEMNERSYQVGTAADLDDVAAIVQQVIQAAGIEGDNLPAEFAEKLLENEQFRFIAGQDATVESILARFSNPIVFHELLDRTFDSSQLNDLCRVNRINLPPRQQKQQIIRLMMNQFEIGTPPPDEHERQIAGELLRIERVLRKFIETIVQDPADLAAKVRDLAQRRRGLDAKDSLYPDAGENPIWRDAEFGHLWPLVKWCWRDAKTYFGSEFYGRDDGARRNAVYYHLEQLRRIRNRVFHLHGELSAGRDIADDRRFIETVGAQLRSTLEDGIELASQGIH